MNQGVKKLDENSFKEAIKNGVVLVDFYTEWCGPCKMLAPVLERVAIEVKDKAVIGKLNIETARAIASEYDVRAFPTMILYKEGQEVGRLLGLRDAETVKEFIEAVSN